MGSNKGRVEAQLSIPLNAVRWPRLFSCSDERVRSTLWFNVSPIPGMARDWGQFWRREMGRHGLSSVGKDAEW